jgi:hypothetical protein
MNYLVPAAWFALLLAIPVIAFYLIKTRLQRRMVSTSLFWQQLTPQIYNTSIWRKLRRWLSLLLQLLFLTALVFALAQPLASWQSLQPASLVIVLDPSISMEATDVSPTRWERARQLAGQRLQQMRVFDEASLLVASNPPQVLSNWTRSKRTLLRALSEARLAGRGTDVRPAVALARNLAEGRTHGQVVLFSDGNWAEPPIKEHLAGVEKVWLSGDSVNTGITLFGVRRAFTGPGEFQLAARVETHGSASVSGTLEIYRDGRIMDAQPLTVEPGKAWEHTWDGRAEQTVRFEARLTGFPPDRLTCDDRAEATLPLQSAVNVELVAPANGFLDAALMSLNHVTWKRIWPAEQLGPAQPGTLYVFYRSLPPPGFSPSACLLIDPTASGFWGELRGSIEQPLVSEFQRESVLLRHAGIENVSLQKAREFSPSPGAEIFAESFGKPLIFGKWSGGSRWLVLPFDLETSDFVLRTAFPIVLGNIVESLRQEATVAAGPPVPGTVESALARTVSDDVPVGSQTKPAATVAWWSAFPIWWWAVAFGAVWLLTEWWSFSRRITE